MKTIYGIWKFYVRKFNQQPLDHTIRLEMIFGILFKKIFNIFIGWYEYWNILYKILWKYWNIGFFDLESA